MSDDRFVVSLKSNYFGERLKFEKLLSCYFHSVGSVDKPHFNVCLMTLPIFVFLFPCSDLHRRLTLKIDFTKMRKFRAITGCNLNVSCSIHKAKDTVNSVKDKTPFNQPHPHYSTQYWTTQPNSSSSGCEL